MAAKIWFGYWILDTTPNNPRIWAFENQDDMVDGFRERCGYEVTCPYKLGTVLAQNQHEAISLIEAGEWQEIIAQGN
jgi:hypothetical protein